MCYLLLLVATTAGGDGVIGRLRRGSSTGSNIGNHLGVESSIGVIDNCIIAAATLVLLTVQCAQELIAACSDLFAKNRKCAFDLCVFDGLCAKLFADSLCSC